ncbi:MAG: quinolinate synthase NadA [Candidatus Caldatribacteriota bacterium]
MAETAAILSPDKIVLLPDIQAGCPMADMATWEAVKKIKEDLPQAVVVSYVNTSAAVKSLSDYCCTSSNAVQIVQAIPREKDILFIPDQNLAQFTAQKTKRKIIPWSGYCPIHHSLSKEEVLQAKKNHPQALLLVHPECRPEVCAAADYIGSTKGIIDFASKSNYQEFIIGTEKGIIFPLISKNPDKKFYWASERMVCPDMKLVSLEKILYSLKELTPQVTVPAPLRKKSLQAINRMVEII